MKISITTLLLFFMLYSYGQVENSQIIGVKIANEQSYSISDTIPIVIYLQDNNLSNNVDIFINSIKVDRNALGTINPNQIESIEVKKNDKHKSPHEIHVVMKDDYSPHFITLNSLKDKYLSIDDLPTLFQLNDSFIDADYNDYVIDENYILNIKVKTIENTKEGLNINIVKIITRTPENLEKANTMIIRGEQ